MLLHRVLSVKGWRSVEGWLSVKGLLSVKGWLSVMGWLSATYCDPATSAKHPGVLHPLPARSYSNTASEPKIGSQIAYFGLRKKVVVEV